MTNTSAKIVFGTGAAVLGTLVVLQLLPTSGVVKVLLLFTLAPLAVLSTLLGVARRPDAAPNQKWFFVMTGVCLAFAVVAVTLIVLMFGVGESK
jgi:hypothetical protein